MTDIYVVMTSDRHTDPDVALFTDETAAVEFAEREVWDNARHPEDITADDYELNDAMRRSGWVWRCRYSCEGDSVRVLRRELKGTAGE